MEAFLSHAQRTVLARISPRHCLLPASSLPLRRLPLAKGARFHGSAHRDDAPLSLSTLGLEDGERARPRKAPARARPPLRKAAPIAVPTRISPNAGVLKRVVTNRGKTVRRIVDIDASIFSAKSFSELDLSPLLASRLDEVGIKVPTEVQSTATPTIAAKQDVVIQSYTGSGKTFAYLLPILSEVGPLRRRVEGEESEDRSGIEAVIVAPSRELGMQIVREVERLLPPADRSFVQQLVGGANRSRQEEALRKNKPVVVVGTPGRIAEISAAGKLHTHGCRFLVLDEVDQLLSFNFREDMHRILEHVGRRFGAQPGKGKGKIMNCILFH